MRGSRHRDSAIPQPHASEHVAGFPTLLLSSHDHPNLEAVPGEKDPHNRVLGPQRLIHHLIIDDTGVARTSEGAGLRDRLLERALPLMTGLQTLEWKLFHPYGLDTEFLYNDKDCFTHLVLPPKAKLMVTCVLDEDLDHYDEYSRYATLVRHLLHNAPKYQNLRYLHVESNCWAHSLNYLLKSTLLGCPQLRVLKVKGFNIEADYGHPPVNVLVTPEQAAKFPPLKELSFENDQFYGNVFEIWGQ